MSVLKPLEVDGTERQSEPSRSPAVMLIDYSVTQTLILLENKMQRKEAAWCRVVNYGMIVLNSSGEGAAGKNSVEADLVEQKRILLSARSESKVQIDASIWRGLNVQCPRKLCLTLGASPFF